MASMTEFQGKKNTKDKRHLDDPQDFYKNLLWTGFQKVYDFQKTTCRYILLETNTAFQQKNIIPAVKHGGGSVMVWGDLL